MADRSPRLSPDFLLQEGVIGGLVAGAIYAAVRTAVAPLLGGSPGDPWKAFASVALWRQAVAGPLTFGVVLAGLVCHFAIAGFYGMVWGVIGGRLPRTLRDGWGSHAAAATAYGVAVYLVDVQIVARIVYPWFLDANQFAELLLHGFAYGLPLGIYLAARLRPLDRFWILAEARARARRDAGR
jgi:hypothetical protein